MLKIKCVKCARLSPEDDVVSFKDSSYCQSCAVKEVYEQGWWPERLRLALNSNGGNVMTDEYQKEVGVIWRRTSKKGESYLFIKMNDKEYVAFENRIKETDKHPDMRIYESRAKEETQAEPKAQPKTWGDTWGDMSPEQRYKKLERMG